ncbi:MAG: adenylosuccinate synthase [candidate division WOR-3 bacterium]
MKKGNVAIIGLQWGDEGKGKLIDNIVESFDVVCRYQGGANAGHTVIYKGERIALHLIPSGIFHPDKISIIGNGVVIEISELIEEIENLKKRGIEIKNNLKISKRSHLILPSYFEEEKEMKEEIGTTGRAIGPAYANKILRKGIRLCDIFSEEYLAKFNLPSSYLEILKIFKDKYGHLVTDTVELLKNLLKRNKRILFEGAQGALLDIDLGTYPYVTSSNPTPGGILTGCGIPPNVISNIIGVTKAYVTRVGKGPLPTKMEEEEEELIRKIGNEFGATTGRARSCGWLDLVALKYAIWITGTTELALTKIDVLDGLPEVKIGVAYEIEGKKQDYFPPEVWQLEKVVPVYKSFPGWNNTKNIKTYQDLPKNAKSFIKFIENSTGVKVRYISTGEERGDLICV